MRKIFLLSLAAMMAISCKDDEPSADNSYPTDNLTAQPVTRSLVGLVYSSKNAAAPIGEIIRGNLETQFGSNVNHISIVNTAGDNLYSAASDSMVTQYGTPPISTFFLNGEVANVADVEASIMQIEDNSNTIPLISVVHTSSQSDTSYNVDVKLQFNDDSTSGFFYVQVYLLGDILAQTYDSGNLDLRQQQDGNYLANSDNSTLWDQTVISSIDSTSLIFSKGNTFVHQSVLLAGFNKENVFGTNLSTYNTFGPEFFRGDILGLRQNPIRQHFLKSDFEDLKFTFTPRFLTVVWNYNFITQRYEYINSYMK